MKEEKLEQLRIVFRRILRICLKDYVSEPQIESINDLLLYEVKIRINNKEDWNAKRNDCRTNFNFRTIYFNGGQDSLANNQR